MKEGIRPIVEDLRPVQAAQVSVAVGTRSHLKPRLEFLMRVLTRAGMTDKANIKMTLYILVYFSQIEFP